MDSRKNRLHPRLPLRLSALERAPALSPSGYAQKCHDGIFVHMGLFDQP